MKLIVLSGPGGVGKSTVISRLRATESDVWVSVSATTRAPRTGEIDGVDYYFLSDSEFDLWITEDKFLEWADFAGARYGTPKQFVNEHLENGKSVLLELEISGARQVRAKNPDALLVFLAPPSWEELEERLLKRGTDTEERRTARLTLARAEMAAQGEFDLTLINTSVEEVATRLISLALH
jgi:guanylate kinase